MLRYLLIFAALPLFAQDLNPKMLMRGYGAPAASRCAGLFAVGWEYKDLNPGGLNYNCTRSGAQAYAWVAVGSGGAPTAGTGILVSGSEVSINSAVVQTLANDQSKAAVYCRSTDLIDTYTCALNPALTAYTRGMYVILDADTANTGAATLAINGLAALSIVTRAGATPANGDVVANRGTLLYYNGTDLSIVGDGGGGTTFKDIRYFATAVVNQPNGYQATNVLMPSNQNYIGTLGSGTLIQPLIYIGDTDLKSVQVVFDVPPGLTNLDVTLDTTDGVGVFTMNVSVACVASGENLSTATYNATAAATGTAGGANILTKVTATAVPITGCVDGELMRLNVARDSSDASTSDIGLIGIRAVMTRNLN